ncbi:MAG: acyl-CoA carboxylase subunit beta [Acidimicrobiales bacterium]|jgi:acetyl-CoA carboxylase carboxyltransferase component|nr:acyl-CoA carboxylase subunit beta [Acidimicrobiales bacterium]HLV89520.1 carboxyl transferase domain-containing protein [Acidimicrobiia bacterium]
MQVLPTRLDPRSEQFRANREAMLARIAELESLQEQARQGGGPKYVERHLQRGKLLPRQRIELLLDPDSYFLELSTLAAWGSDKPLGANIITGIGVINGVECAILANDPTSQAGVFNRYTLAKSLRIMDIAMENRLPLINLVESGGADLPDQAEVFVVGGKWFRNLTRLSKMGIPTVSLVFGSSTAGGAYFPAMCDYAVMVKEQAKVFLGGPPLVKMATGEESTDEELGGAEMHSRISGLSDYFAETEEDAIRIGRDIVAHFNWRKQGYGPTRDPEDPVYDPDEILGVIPADLRVPFDMREIVARFADGSRFEEYKAAYGTSILNGWAHVHGYPVGIIANQQGVIFGPEAQKTTEFIQLCNRYDTPIIFMHNTTGYMVGKEYEQGGIIKDGAKMINAVANSEVPHISIMAGVSYGAGNYGMSGRAYDPRFVFGYPGHKVAVMGPRQLAGVMSIVARQAAESRGEEFDEDADAQRTAELVSMMEETEQALYSTGRVRDDGLIDPRDTRTVLGIALSAIHSGPVKGTDRFGVFRM